MMTLTINGKEEKLNIGCRTFISLYELLHLLEVPSERNLSVLVNKQDIGSRDYMHYTISNGDHLTIDSTKTA